MTQVITSHHTPITSVPTTNKPIFFVPRHGQILKRTWDELTTTERDDLRQAEQRAAYVQQFSIYGW